MFSVNDSEVDFKRRAVFSPSTENGAPPPAVVLGRQLKVGERNGNACSHTQQDSVHDEENAVQRVLLATPQRREDVVQLHGNRTEIMLCYISGYVMLHCNISSFDRSYLNGKKPPTAQ